MSEVFFDFSDKAIAYDVSRLIHKNDFIFHHISNVVTSNLENAVTEYFSVGSYSYNKVMELTSSLNIDLGQNFILDFASGYGCVTRHFNACSYREKIHCCDLHTDAVDFIRHNLGFHAFKSDVNPSLVSFDIKYKLIFALSFFSHMPDATFASWLRTLSNNLADDGFLLFTTHGLASSIIIGVENIPESGIWFMAQSEQHDLDQLQYGTTITSFDYVNKMIKNAGLRLVYYKSSDWWGHQDTYVVKKEM